MRGQGHARPLFTPRKDPVPSVQEAGGGGLQGRCGQVRKISPPPGFDTLTVHPVAQSLYRLSYPAHENCYRHLVFGTDQDKKYAYMLHVKEWFSVHKYKHGDHANLSGYSRKNSALASACT
jgi:hypothetical protein